MKKKNVGLLIIVIVLVLISGALATMLYAPRFVSSLFPNVFTSSVLQKSSALEHAQEPEILGKIETVTHPTSYQSFIQSTEKTLSGDQIIDIDMKRLGGLYKLLNNYYLWDIDYDKVYDAMATAMFDTLGDKYSYYVKADQAEDYHDETMGKYGGLGFYFSKHFVKYQNADDIETLYCNISQVFPNTPSSRGGLQAGDKITKINGQDVSSLEATECAKLMKGEPGSPVSITVLRNSKTFELSLIREIVTVPTVEYTMLDNKMGYILILKFTPDTVNKFGEVLVELQKQGMKSLIIDLRDNPGGDVDTTLNIANYFISSSDLLTINYKDSNKNTTYRATPSTLIKKNVPIAILVNGGTASSAEILSSTMRDNGRATLIGTKTFGKGIMQIITSYGDGYASITTASFIPPSGNEIHKVGVSPDIEVKSIEINDDERDAYTKLLESKILSEFVEKHPDYTKNNVALFVKQNPNSGLRDEVLTIAIRNEYYIKMGFDNRPKADTWFDPQIKKAIEVLSK